MSVKKNYVPFIAGMTCMVLLIGGISGSLAAEDGSHEATVVTTAEHPAGNITDPALEKVYAGQAGVALFGKEKLAPGAGRTNGQGAEVPAVLTYVDETGTANYYVSAETVAELLDVAAGVTYNEELNCVDFGSMIMRGASGEERRFSSDKNYGEARASDGQGNDIIVGVGDRQPEHVMSTGSGTVTVSVGSTTSRNGAKLESSSEETREWMLKEIEERIQKRRKNATAPSYGVSHGAYTEVNPAEIDRSTYMGAFLYQDTFQSDEKVSTRLEFAPYAGNYGLLTIENQGEDDILVTLKRINAIGENGDEYFSVNVRVPKGQTLERAFRIEDVSGAELQNVLRLEAESCDSDVPVKVRLSAEQYRA